MRILRSASFLLTTLILTLSLSSFVQPFVVVVPPAMVSIDAKGKNIPEWNVPKVITAPKEITAMNFGPELSQINQEDFLALTPAKYKQMTGHKLGIIKSMELKWAQNKVRKSMKSDGGGDVPQWLYVVLSILALGWLAIGIKSNWKGNDWWIALLLYFVFYFPGLIYSLVVMKKYY